MRRATGALLLAVAAVLLAGAAPAFAYSEKFERTLPLRNGGSFVLANVNGSVQVETWDREEVYVLASKESKANPVDESRVQIEIDASPDAVAVVTRYPQEDGLDVTVEYRVRVPARLLHANISTVNGSIRARGLDASGELRTVNGDVELLDGAGRLSARTTNGNIRLELADLDAPADAAPPVRIETINGSVVLELPANVNANLEVVSMNGDFQSELPVAVRSSSAAGEIAGRLGRGGPLVRVRTVNGGIRIVTAKTAV